MPAVKIKSFEGVEFDAYLAQPVNGNGVGLVVIHDVFGIDDDLRHICDDHAAHGYTAVCPDLVWRQQGSEKTPSDKESVAAFLASFDVEAALRDMISAFGYLRKAKGSNGKVGVIGYGLGARLAFLMAARTDVDVSVGYCPLDLDKSLDEIHDVRMPLLLHVAGNDSFVPESKRGRILDRLAGNPVIKTETYRGVGHGFILPMARDYTSEASLQANLSTKEFLIRALSDE